MRWFLLVLIQLLLLMAACSGGSSGSDSNNTDNGSMSPLAPDCSGFIVDANCSLSGSNNTGGGSMFPAAPDCSDRIAEVNCNINLDGATEEFLMAGDRDFFRFDLKEAGTLSLWILGSLDIAVYLLNEEEASSLRQTGDSMTSRPYFRNFVGDELFYELSAGTYYLVIDNEGSPTLLTLRTSFQPDLADSCGSTRDTACPLDITNSAGRKGNIYPINDADLFEINITEAGRLTAWLESPLDSEARLLDENENQVFFDDDGGYGYDFKVSYTFSSTELGLYYLDISAIDPRYAWDYPRFGSYELFVQFIPQGEELECELVVGRQSSSGPDPLLDYQWYLGRIGVKEVWGQGYEGEGVHISIVDDGLDMMHEDLRENVVLGAGRNYLVAENHPSRHIPLPTDCWDDGHGTSVAGIAAARGDNGLGIKGVAPKAGTYMANYLQNQKPTNLMEALSPKTNETLVSVNSWESIHYTRLTREYKLVLDVVEANLNHSLNRSISYVFAAGNGRNTLSGASEQMSTYEEIQNHRGIIPVCAVNAINRYASYSNPGANLWVCAPSGDDPSDMAPTGLGSSLDEWQRGLPTTDLTGRAGYNQALAPPPPGSWLVGILLEHLDFGSESFYYQSADYRSDYISHSGNLIEGLPGTTAYTRFFDGTSAAAPVVGGVIALIRSAYPTLSWRDVKLILAESAEKVDVLATSWQTGAAAYHTGSDYTHSIDYGFGLVDAAAALDLARQWQALPSELHHETIEKTISTGFGSVEGTINVGDIDLDFIEYVQLEIDSSYSDFGDLNILLISPKGTQSLVARSHICDIKQGEAECDDLEGGFTFASAAHLGEDPQGDWILRISGIDGSIEVDWKLRFYGHKRRS